VNLIDGIRLVFGEAGLAAGMLRLRLVARYGAWNAFLMAGAAYLIVVIAVGLALPVINEVPGQFPAVVLWQFRIASMGAQIIMWATIGLVFGALMERANRHYRLPVTDTPQPVPRAPRPSG